MGLPAVGLDDQAVRGPVEVRLALAVVGGVERLVADRLGQVGAADEPEHPDLPHALGDLRLLPGRLRQDAGSAVAVGAGDDVVDGALVVELQVHGLCQRALELVCSCGCRQVEQGAVDRRDRDAFVVGGVLGIEGTRRVQADPRDAVAAAGRGHVDALLARWRAAPSGRPRCDGSGPRRARRPGLPPAGGPRARSTGGPRRRRRGGPDATGPRPHRRCAARAPPAQRAQLRARHHSPLPLSQLGQRATEGVARLGAACLRFSAATPRACQATRDSGHRKRNNSPQLLTPRCPSRAPRARAAPISSAACPRKPTSSRSGAISPRRCRGRAATR